MKKFTSLGMVLVLLFLVACQDSKSIKSQKFLLNTIVTLDVECDKDTLDGAFSLCEKYEKLLSKTIKESDVSKLNESNTFIKVSKPTKYLIDRSIYYGNLSGGKFDITICPVSNLWDFEGTALPDKDEIAEALQNVDYEAIRIDGDSVFTGDKQIDFGGIAKGYIADELLKFFKKKNVKNGIINLGGNIMVFGDKEKKIGIKKPFSDNIISATLKVKNKSVVTSGVYERYIEKYGKIYHHILDPDTGFAVKSDLFSATVIGKNSLDCDALATVCILEGLEKAKKLIENTDDIEAVFIDKDYNLEYTSGLKKKDGYLILK